MTRAELKALINRYLEFEAQPSEISAGDRDAAINQGLALFTEMTLCLYRDNTPITTAVGVSIVDLRSLEPPVLDPISVALTTPLRDTTGAIGPISADEMRYLDRTVTGAAKRWAKVGLTSIRIHPTPNAVVTGFVEGFCVHPALDDDADLILIPKEFERTAAAFLAARIIDPRSSGSSLEKMAKIDQIEAANMTRMLERAKRYSGYQELMEQHDES